MSTKDIDVSTTSQRAVHMNQVGDTLVVKETLYNWRGPDVTQTVNVTPQELAYIVLCASGQFVEAFDAEMERLIKNHGKR